MFGVFWKIQEICSKMGSKIFKIDWEMSEIMESKVDNPKNSVSRNWAILCLPWNLTFLYDEIYHLFSCLYGSKVPKWKGAHILLLVVVKLSGDQAEGKTKEGEGGDLGSERPLLHWPTLIWSADSCSQPAVSRTTILYTETSELR